MPIVLATIALAAAAATAAPAPPELAVVRDGDIWVVRADGSGLRNLTRSPSREYAPAWSPDGRRLVFVGYRHGQAELYVANGDGGGVRRLTRDEGEDLTPAWSPDGSRIAFASNRTGVYEIYVMDADGGNVRRLTQIGRGGYGSFSPTWSPDGKRLVFSNNSLTPENAELYSISASGQSLKRLTRTKGNSEVLGDDGMPHWSRDGSRIVFTSNRTADGEIWVMRPDGTGQRRLGGLPRRDDFNPKWSPDGKQIAFDSHAAGRDVYVIGANGRGLRLLLKNAGEPAWRPLG